MCEQLALSGSAESRNHALSVVSPTPSPLHHRATHYASSIYSLKYRPLIYTMLISKVSFTSDAVPRAQRCAARCGESDATCRSISRNVPHDRRTDGTAAVAHVTFVYDVRNDYTSCVVLRCVASRRRIRCERGLGRSRDVLAVLVLPATQFTDRTNVNAAWPGGAHFSSR